MKRILTANTITITAELESQVSEAVAARRSLTIPKEYRTIQGKFTGPLMLVRDVEGCFYDELAEIELANGENATLHRYLK